MAKFYVDDKSPIVAELIRQDFDFEESEALRLIDMDETANNTDGTFALGTGAACIVATAGTLALSGFTLPILVPVIGVGLSSITYWNSKVAARNREMETQFLSDHPEVLVKVCSKIRAGESRDTIAAAFEQCLRAYRWGDMKQMDRVLGTTTQTQSGIQPTNAQDATTTIGSPLAQTELQNHSPTAGNMVAAAPSYGVLKDRSPVDMLVDALFAHRAIFGGQRTGKSLLASIASLGIVEKKPGTKVFYINVFAFDAAETKAMYAHAHRKVVFDLAPASQFQAASIISAVSDLFDEFIQTTGAILIIDEAATMGDIRGNHVEAFRPLVESLTGYLGSIRDSSKKRRKAVWTIAPGIVAADLDPGMKSLMKGFSPILVSIPKLRSVYWEGQLLGSDTNLIAAQLKVNYPGYTFEAPHMNCDRACLIDGIWMPLGTLSIPVAKTIAQSTARTIETTAIQDDTEYSQNADALRYTALIDTAMVKIATSSGDTRSHARDLLQKSNTAYQESDLEKAIKLVQDAINV